MPESSPGASPPAAVPVPQVAQPNGQRVRPSWLVGALLTAILLARFAFGLLFSLEQPPLESHDETGHTAYVAFVADHLALPPPGGQLTPYFDEGHQPPLYYVVPGAIGYILGWTGEYAPPMNPFFLSGDGSRGVNAAVHVPSVEDPPWSPPLLLLHLARFWSVLLGAFAVWLTWRIGREVFPTRPDIALAGAAISAFVPTSLAVFDAVTNDALVPVTFGLTLLAALLLIRTPTQRNAALLGVCTALALLTKNSALILLPFDAMVLAIAWFLQRPHLRVASTVRLAAVTFGTTFVLAGWWYLRNELLFGHWITDRQASNPLLTAPGAQTAAMLHDATGGFFATLVAYSFRSFWVLMGWGTLGAPEVVYIGLQIACLLCIVGLLWLGLSAALRRTPLFVRFATPSTQAGANTTAAPWKPLPGWLGPLLLAAFFLVMLPEPLYRAIYYQAPTLVPGRYLMGGLGAAALLLALGWSAFVGRLHFLLALPGLAQAVLSLWLLVNVIEPAYAAPPPVAAGTAIPNPVDIVYGGRMHLVGYSVAPASVQPGGSVHVVLYWQAERPMQRAYTVGVHVVDISGNSLGEVDSFPGRGNLATPLWQMGATYADPYDIPVAPDAPMPQLGQLYVGVQLLTLEPQPGDATHRVSKEALSPTNSAGASLTPFVGRFRIGAVVTPDSSPLQAQFGAMLGLLHADVPTAARAGDDLAVTLTLRALTAPLPRLVVFAHLLRADGSFVVGTDAEPIAGRYPTDLWPVADPTQDTLRIKLPPNLPAGAYHVEVGVYDQKTQQRLPVTVNNQQQPDNRLVLGPIVVSAP